MKWHRGISVITLKATYLPDANQCHIYIYMYVCVQITVFMDKYVLKWRISCLFIDELIGKIYNTSFMFRTRRWPTCIIIHVVRGESPGCRLFGKVSMLEWLRNPPPLPLTGEQYGKMEPKYPEGGHCQSVLCPQRVFNVPLYFK